MEIYNPSSFELKHVHNIYNQISEHFNQTRYHTWPIIKKFVESFTTKSIVGDIGCGNGRNCLLRDDCTFIGTDISEKLLNICMAKGIKCILANNLSLPIKGNYFDYTMSIAVIHHFCNTERRLKAVSELIRVTKSGGKILIYVWAKEQKKFSNNTENDILIPWNLQKKYNEGNCEILDRYYHLFDQGELESLISHFNNVKIIENGYQKDNWYVIIEKN
jgi:tRNA (uracil-5-)-methyltransferase TRM9